MEKFLSLNLTMISWAGSTLVNKWPIWGIIHRLIGNPSDTFNLSFEDWDWNKHPLPQSTMNKFSSSLRADISDCWSCLKQMGGGQSANLQDKFSKNELIRPKHSQLCECGKVLKWSVHWRKGLPVDFALEIQVPNMLLYITTSAQRLSILCTTSTTEQHFYILHHYYNWAALLSNRSQSELLSVRRSPGRSRNQRKTLFPHKQQSIATLLRLNCATEDELDLRALMLWLQEFLPFYFPKATLGHWNCSLRFC